MNEMARVFIAVGSNINPYINIPEALQMLKEVTRLEAVSSFYETEPIGNPEQPVYVNGVLMVTTGYGPRELKFDVLRDIENRLGRIRTADKNAPRSIDLDIILYDDLVMDAVDIVIPDPAIYNRAFVAIPVFELDPDLMIPGKSIQISQIADKLKDVTMRRLDDFASILRSEIDNES